MFLIYSDSLQRMSTALFKFVNKVHGEKIHRKVHGQFF